MKRAQALVEFALVLTMGLFVLAGAIDLLYNFSRQGLVEDGIAFAASVAALGRPDAEVVIAARGRSQGIIQPERLSHTPCWQRTLPGAPIFVETTWGPTPLTPFLQRFWSGIWREAPKRVDLAAAIGCPEGVLP